jgi:hypothetical protein
VCAYVQRLYDEGFSLEHIQKKLTQFGYALREDTLRTLVDPSYERLMRLQREAAERRAVWEEKLARMRELREAGLPYSAVGKVMRLDYGLILDDDSVRRMLQGVVSNRTIARNLTDPRDTLRDADTQD